MAAGVVSGAVADLLQASPRLTPDQVKARLMETAWKSLPRYSSTTDPTTGITYTDQYDVFTVGAGYLDLEAALASPDVARGTAMSPISTYDSNTGSLPMQFDPSAVWNTSAMWGSSAMWDLRSSCLPHPQCGDHPRCGVAARCGEAVRCGALRPCGDHPQCGAVAQCGVHPQCGKSNSAMWGSSVSAGEQN